MDEADVDRDQDTRNPSPLLILRRYDKIAFVTSSGHNVFFATWNTNLN